MKFSSRKDTLFNTIILGVYVLLFWTLYLIIDKGNFNSEAYVAIILVLSVIALIAWIFYGTHYTLTKEQGLAYRSGPIHGSIGLERIREIVKGQTLWVGLKPATATKGLVIKYDKYEEIYISPETNDSFIKKITELNPDILITQYQASKR